MIVVQKITTTWSKLSRGAPQSANRNAVPEVFPISVRDVGEAVGALLMHSLHCSEWDNFSIKESLENHPLQEDHWRVETIIIYPDEDKVSIEFYKTTPPRKTGKYKKIFVLGPNEWEKLLYNERYSEGDGYWQYQKVVMNVGNFTKFSSNLFIQNSPSYLHDHTGHLF